MNDLRNDTGSWVADGLRREVFFFPCGDRQLYGSLYASAAAEPTSAVAICNSWGFEGNQAGQTAHEIALGAARSGGAGVIFHYPGYGDSPGDLAEASADSLVEATVAALAEGSRRLPGLRWTLAGLMFGASVAILTTRRTVLDRLLLVQPMLDSQRYFLRLERSARRAAARIPARAGNAYGYPLPHRIIERAAEIDAEVKAALDSFGGEVAVVRYEEPEPAEGPLSRFEQVTVPGTWRFGARQKPDLARATAGWLRNHAAGVPG